MARRIPLPRLTQRQRQARWQRERRQQTIIIVVFTVLLCSAVGLMIWAGTNRYYDDNLKPAALIESSVGRLQLQPETNRVSQLIRS